MATIDRDTTTNVNVYGRTGFTRQDLAGSGWTEKSIERVLHGNIAGIRWVVDTHVGTAHYDTAGNGACEHGAAEDAARFFH